MFRSKTWAFLAIVAALGLSSANRAEAGFLLQDNFNGENGGNGALNFNSFTNWNVTNGTVDLIGNGFFDLLPGNGLYLDLDGSTFQAGLLSSKLTFAPGTYVVQFDLAGSQRGTPENVTVTLGSFSESFHRESSDPFTTVTRTVTTTSAGSLSFQNDGGDNVGALLDNVSVSTSAVPEPASLALVGTGVACLMGYSLHRRKTKA